MLGEAMAAGPKNGPERTVLALKRPKTDRSGQTPHSQSQRVGVRSPDRCLVIDPDCQRCAQASVPYGSVIQGTLVVRSACSRTARRHALPERCLTHLRGQPCPVGQRTGLATALAVGVEDADTCGPPASPGPLRRPWVEAPSARILSLSLRRGRQSGLPR